MVVRNKKKKRVVTPKKLGLHWLLIISIVFGEFLAFAWVRIESTQTILRISRFQDIHADKVSYNKALAVERDRLKSDDRITRIAKTRLNLISGTLDRTIYLPGEED